MLRIGKSEQALIGVDITSATVKLLELRLRGQQYHVESYAVRPLREGAVVDRRIRDLDEVVEVIQRVVEHAKPRTRRVAVAIPTAAVITKTLTVPASLTDEEIEARIQIDADKHIPFPLSEVAFDFQRMGMNARHGDQQDILLVACRQQDVTQITDAVSQAGLEPAAVDTETFALERAFQEVRQTLHTPQNEGDCVALVDIGANMNAFHVLEGGRTIYTRDTVFGGKQLTESIRKHYNLSLEEAGLAKKRGGLPDDYFDAVLNPFLGTLTQQIGRALQLYYTAGTLPEVQRLILAGGSCVVPGLSDRLALESGMTVDVANPFTNMRVASRIDVQTLSSDAPAMLTACGLAMRARS